MASPPEISGKTVLVVDDEPAVANTLAIILRKKGFNAMAVYSGEDAIRAVEKLSPDYAVVSDIMLKGMSGVEVGIRIRAVCPTCEVILFSGAAGSSDLLDVARAQGQEFEVLAKPFDPERLIELLRAA